jgi:A/G-specific adenine glycosylase
LTALQALSPRTTSVSVFSAITVRKVLRWYKKHGRDLPWRHSREPYLVWLSEILLQQTQVETVRPYFLRLSRAFPTVERLAAAPLGDVLKLWEGCGYYARARNLHKAAQIIVKEHGGILPKTAAELRKLPGIGTYTAAAIASICHDEFVPVIDGNIERVLARVLCERRLIKSTAAQKRLHTSADAALKIVSKLQGSSGAFNQALMEIGARICTPRRADCRHCPLQTDCRGTAQLADVTVLPRKIKAPRTPHYDIGAAVIRKNGKILITQRPLDGMLGGLWEFPGGKQHESETLEQCVQREIREELSIEISVGVPIASVKHAFTQYRITLHAFDCRHLSGRIQKLGIADYRWIFPSELKYFAFPKADQVILTMLQSGKLRT